MPVPLRVLEFLFSPQGRRIRPGEEHFRTSGWLAGGKSPLACHLFAGLEELTQSLDSADGKLPANPLLLQRAAAYGTTRVDEPDACACMFVWNASSCCESG